MCVAFACWCMGTRSWSLENRNVECVVLACLGREAGTAVELTGDGNGTGPPGAPGTQTTGTPGWELTTGPPEAPAGPAALKGCGKGNVPHHTPSPLASSGTKLMGFPSPGSKSCGSPEGWRCWGPQLGGDPVSAGLLGVGLLLVWKGVKSTHSIARVDDGAGATLHGRWNHWFHGK